MRQILIDGRGATIRFTLEELGILASSLNELSNSTDDADFELQVGASKSEVHALIDALVMTLEKGDSLLTRTAIVSR